MYLRHGPAAKLQINYDVIKEENQNMRKRVISIFLALALLAAVLPIGSLTAGAASETDIPYAVEGGSIYFDKETGTVTDCSPKVTYAEIPAQIEGVPVTRIGEQAFSYCDELYMVSIPASVTSISSDAFDYCSELECIYVDEANENYASDEWVLFNKDKTVLLRYPEGLGCPCGYALYYTIPETVTEIADYAFFGNGLVREITLPESLTSIGDYAFLGCRGLEAMLFKGNAPETGENFLSTYNEDSKEYELISGVTVYYAEGKEGWTSPTWNGYPTATWDPTHEHDFETVVAEPTCTEDGYEKYVCSCGYEFIVFELGALGHDYQDGVCTRCGELESEHKCEYKAVVTDPTCTEQGYTTYTCAGCRDSYVADYVDALGHDYHEGVCTLCGEAEIVILPVNFNDVPEDAWYKLAVDYAVGKELMKGTGDGNFEPESPMTRAMLVTVLWRYAGEPTKGENVFSDIEDGQWYAEAVAWAAEIGVVDGVGDGEFDPDGKITREQMAAILYRYCSAIGIDTSNREALTGFPDGDKVSTYAQEASSWAFAEGLITGSEVDSKVYLDPQGNATRAQVATILMRFIENVT